MRRCKKSCKCYFCDGKRWEAAWEKHKKTKEYAEAAVKERKHIAKVVYFSLVDDGPHIRELADDKLSFEFFRKLGRYQGRNAPRAA